MAKYRAFARSAFQTQFAYRSEVWAAIFGQLVVIFARVSIWTSVYAGMAAVNGVTLQDMVTYALLGGTVMAAWSYSDLLNAVGRSVRTGDVAVYLLRPLHYPLFLFATECGNLAFRLVTVVLPTVAIVAAVYGMLPPASLFHGVLFPAFWLLSFLLLFLMAATAGLAAFWLMTAFSLDWLLGGILSILSGTFIPLWFFPESIAEVITWLPFAYVGYYPAAVYLGKLDPAATMATFAVGLGWAVVLSGLLALLWSRAARRLVVQGG